MNDKSSRREFLKASLAAGGAAMFGSGCSSLTEPAKARDKSDRPNVVIIFSDDATPAYHSCYGGRTPTAAIDAIAAGGVKFTNAHCVTSLCCPSRHTLLSGQFAGHDPRIIEDTPPGEPYTVVQNANLTPRIPNIGRTFSQAGYRTGFLGKWHNNWKVKEAYPEFQIIPRDADPHDPAVDRALGKQQEIYSSFIKDMTGFDHVSHVIMANHVWIPRKLRTHHVEWMTRGALDFIDDSAKRDEPFLLYLAPTVIHSPNTVDLVNHDPRYTPGGKVETPFTCHPPRSSLLDRARKADLPLTDPVGGMQIGMLMLDDQVRAVERKLHQLGIAENTIVLYASDNGMYGKGSAYYPGSHEAFVMKWPGHIRPGTLVDQPVSFVDVAPTLLAACGIDADHPSDGINILPAVAGKKLPRDTVYMELGYTRAVLKGKYHYVAFRLPESKLDTMRQGEVDVALDHWGVTSKGFTRMNAPYKPAFFQPDQLYDVEADPFERNNLADNQAYAGVLKEMKAELARYTDRFDRPFPLEVPAFMESEDYAGLVAARRRAIARKDSRLPGHDEEKLINLNLADPAAGDT
jgi:arylsulfatase A-like enzyme